MRDPLEKVFQGAKFNFLYVDLFHTANGIAVGAPVFVLPPPATIVPLVSY